MIRSLPSLPIISLAGLESVSGVCRSVATTGASARTVASVIRLTDSRRAADIGTGRGGTLHAACTATRGGRVIAVDLPPGDARRSVPDADLATVASAAGLEFRLIHADADNADLPRDPGVVVVDSDDSVEVPVLRAAESDAVAIVVPSLGRVGRRQQAIEALAGSGYWAAHVLDADALVATRCCSRWMRGRKL